jgi:hypothetical protein
MLTRYGIFLQNYTSESSGSSLKDATTNISPVPISFLYKIFASQFNPEDGSRKFF